MFEIANRIAETTPAIIDRKYLFILTFYMCRRIKKEVAYPGIGPQAGRRQRNETRFEND
jgi:hypothetical protein